MRHINSLRLSRTLVVTVSTVVGLSIPVGVAGAASRASAIPAAHSSSTVVSVTLTANSVRSGVRTKVTVSVLPRTLDRVVYLRRLRGTRFVNIAVASTNRLGQAIFHPSFHGSGQVSLNAMVKRSSSSRGASSAPVIENVTDVLPFVLAPNAQLKPGDTGPAVLQLQQRLSALGYWLGTPNGNFGDATEQAVYALEKAAGINRSGIVGPQFAAALSAGALPQPRTTTGNAIEVNLKSDLVLFVRNGVLAYVLNTSTGGGYTYVQDGATDVATTPTGVFSIGRVVDGLVTDSLGSLWRPRFFYEGYALHGDGYVPPVPVSHGCVRVSNEAIDWVWAENLAPIGMKFWVY